MTEHYDSSWDSDDDEDAFDRKYEEWQRRDWITWLSDKLSFPFEVKRKEDMEENPFAPNRGPFSVGRRMQAVSLEEEDCKYGAVIQVTDGMKKGSIPLADVEVTSKKDTNYWPVREYVVWAANH